MRLASPVEMLTLWEQGRGKPLLRQALLLLAAWLDQPADELARLSIGERDFALLNLQSALFGPEMVGLGTCPACHQRVELRLNADEIASLPSLRSGETLTATHDSYEASFRLPTSLDLSDLPAEADLSANRRRVLERCLVEARCGETDVPLQEVPEALVNAIVCRMGEADPLADIQLTVACPECQHRWEAPFDIASFAWSQLNARAERLLHEVHLLASAYGWTEHDILHLPAARRQFYLSLITG